MQILVKPTENLIYIGLTKPNEKKLDEAELLKLLIYAKEIVKIDYK